MKKKIALILLFITIVTFSACAFSGCGNGSKRAFNVGFGYQNYIMTAFLCAAESDCTQFDVADVSLDFAYGWGDSTGGNEYYRYSLKNYDVPVCIALYLSVREYHGLETFLESDCDDYKNVDGYRFIKEVSVEEFNTADYKVVVKMLRGKIFAHKETLNVPANLFEFSKGYLQFDVIAVYYSEENQNYYFSRSGEHDRVEIPFTVADNRVTLLKY